jgi:lipopolysaccharide export system protein LptC
MRGWLVLIFILLVGLSIWVFFPSRQSPSQKPQPPSEQVLDGYMIEAHYTQYDLQGQVHMTLYSPQVTHYVQNSTSYFEKPEVLAYNEKRIPWTIKADRGTSLRDSQQVDLNGNVIIHQAPQPQYPETTITTTAMTIYPHRSYAVTDQPIVILRPDTRVEGVGMQADFKQGIFKLLSSVKAIYVPPAPAK